MRSTINIRANNIPNFNGLTQYSLSFEDVDNGYVVGGFVEGKPVKKAFTTDSYKNKGAAKKAALSYYNDSIGALETHLDSLEKHIQSKIKGIDKDLKEQLKRQAEISHQQIETHLK